MSEETQPIAYTVGDNVNLALVVRGQEDLTRRWDAFEVKLELRFANIETRQQQFDTWRTRATTAFVVVLGVIAWELRLFDSIAKFVRP